MKLLLTLLFVCTSTFAQHQLGDHPSVHGMVILGSHKIYLSHLPMFHSPHNYQAIMEVTFEADARIDHGFHTLVPEKFSLPAMMKNPRAFKADIYSGHFERGGKLVGKTVVRIRKVLHFRKLDPEGLRSDRSTYLIFGNAEEQFMAHKISSRPDFDHLVKIEGPLSGVMEERTFDFPDTKPYEEGEEIYFETGDLSH